MTDTVINGQTNHDHQYNTIDQPNNNTNNNHDNTTTLTEELWFSYDEIIDSISIGIYHYYLLIICGLANASDAIEIMSASFILPNATNDLQLDDHRKGILGGIIFIGMMLGGYIWGNIADKYGRKNTLIYALCINSIGGLCSSISSTYIYFILFRLISGIGVGGSVPILFTYYCEFLPTSYRGQYMVYLAWFWMIGSICTVGLAYAIIPIDIQYTLPYIDITLHSWRIFCILCSILSLITSLLLITCPESPRFLILQGHSQQALNILKTIYLTNKRVIRLFCNRTNIDNNDTVIDEYDNYSNDNNHDNNILQSQQSPFSNYNNDNSNSNNNNSYQITKQINDIDNEKQSMLHNNNNAITYDIFDTNDFYSNVQRFQQLLKTHKQSSTIHTVQHSSVSTTTYRQSVLQNIKRTIELFDNNKRRNSIKLMIVWFFMSFGYYGLTMWLPSYFDTINTDKTNNINEYLSAFLNAIANLPGNIISAYTVESYGRRITLVFSLLFSSIVSLFIPLASNNISSLILVCILGGVSVGSWNTLNIVTTELYNTHNRSTAYGFMAALGRIGAVFGNIIFAKFINISASIPLFITSAMFAIASISACLLPETIHKLIQ